MFTVGPGVTVAVAFRWIAHVQSRFASTAPLSATPVDFFYF
jgi:hypothetical protein